MLPFSNKEPPELGIQKQSLDLTRQNMGVQAGLMDDQAYIQNQEQREQILKWQQDMTFELEELKHDLANEVLDPNTNTYVRNTEIIFDNQKGDWVEQYMLPRMNSQGIGFVLTNIKRYISRNTMRCSLDSATIYKKMQVFGNDMAIALAVNYDTFGINLTEYPSLNSTIRSFVHFTLLRALNDGERRNEREIRRLIESTMDRPEQKQKMKLFGGS